MATKKNVRSARAAGGQTAKRTAKVAPTSAAEVLAALRRAGTKKVRDDMLRYGIVAPKAFGVRVAALQQLAKKIGRDHALAQELWASGFYEARMLAGFVDEPALVTAAQMERQCRDFDNWAICDHLCFHLWDRTPHAFAQVSKWARRREEFVKRAAFALLASLALHDKAAGDAPFLACLPLAERAATDERNFVKKGVSWALRGIGMRSLALHTAVMSLAERLVGSGDPAAAWVGRDVRRDLARPLVTRRLSV